MPNVTVHADDPVRRALWWMCLFVAPAILVAIELYHPAGFTQHPGMYEYLSKPEPYSPAHHALAYPGPSWWYTVHMIQTPMMGLVAVGLWLLVDRVWLWGGAAAGVASWLSRACTFVFFVYDSALDSIGGIGLGKTIEITERFEQTGQLTADQVKGVALVLNTMWSDPWVGGVGSFISETGSWAVFFSTVFAAIALWLTSRAPWPALLILVAFGWELQVSHTMPHGPIAFSLLIVAGLWMWVARSRHDAAARTATVS